MLLATMTWLKRNDLKNSELADTARLILERCSRRDTKWLASWASDQRLRFGWHGICGEHISNFDPHLSADRRSTHGYAALKVYISGVGEEEFTITQALSNGNLSHPGRAHVRNALGVFTISRAGGEHKCLVQKPMCDSFKDLLRRNPKHRFTEELFKAGLIQIFLALDYLHSDCKLVHTGRLQSEHL
jgi:hypothetical protein